MWNIHHTHWDPLVFFFWAPLTLDVLLFSMIQGQVKTGRMKWSKPYRATASVPWLVSSVADFPIEGRNSFPILPQHVGIFRIFKIYLPSTMVFISQRIFKIWIDSPWYSFKIFQVEYLPVYHDSWQAAGRLNWPWPKSSGLLGRRSGRSTLGGILSWKYCWFRQDLPSGKLT